MQVTEPLVTVHKAPRFDAMQLTQALMGETLLCFDVAEGWAFVQLDADGYVGYVAAHALSDRVEQGTHRVAVPATHIYTAASIKTQPAVAVTMNAVVNVVSDDGKFARLSDGRFMFLRHLWPVGEHEPDFVSVAERFLHVPYYWGGKSVHGIDCSGLVQLSLAAAGIACLRDSDMQESSLGTVLGLERLDDLRRGDLVFWSGHVGIMTDTETLLHANGHHMMVVANRCAPRWTALPPIMAG